MSASSSSSSSRSSSSSERDSSGEVLSSTSEEAGASTPFICIWTSFPLGSTWALILDDCIWPTVWSPLNLSSLLAFFLRFCTSFFAILRTSSVCISSSPATTVWLLPKGEKGLQRKPPDILLPGDAFILAICLLNSQAVSSDSINLTRNSSTSVKYLLTISEMSLPPPEEVQAAVSLSVLSRMTVWLRLELDSSKTLILVFSLSSSFVSIVFSWYMSLTTSPPFSVINLFPCLYSISSSSSCWICLLRAEMTWEDLSWFTTIMLVMFLARFAYLKVLRVSTKSLSEGEIQAIIKVLELPPRESCKNLVNFESL